MVPRIVDYGYGFIPGPADVPDGRKLAFAYNPLLVEPVGELVNVKTHPAFMGRRNGKIKKRRMGNRWLLGQQFRVLASGALVWHFAGHVVPSVNRNMPQVRADNRRTAEVLEGYPGALVCFKDWNFDLASGSGKKLAAEFRRLFDGYTVTAGNPRVGTWGKREIDWGLVREGLSLRLVGKDARKIPGREKGGGVGHKFVTARCEVRVP